MVLAAVFLSVAPRGEPTSPPRPYGHGVPCRPGGDPYLFPGCLGSLCAMAAVLWLRSRAKFATGVLDRAVGLFVYSFAPQHWFDRMETIQNYEDDPSATGRISYWKIALRIAESHPVMGGGFWVTHWPDTTNAMLQGTNLPRLTIPGPRTASVSKLLSEHGWVGLALFVMIGVYSWLNCSWLIRRSRVVGRNSPGQTRSEKWARPSLVGFWVGGDISLVSLFRRILVPHLHLRRSTAGGCQGNHHSG